MRILLVAHYFQPESSLIIGLPFAKELIRRGHEVEVLTGFPNYPGGKIYDGYHLALLQRETIEGIPIIRVPLYPSHSQSNFGRFLCYASLGVSAATIGTFAIKSADVVHVAQGPATVGLPACVIRLLRGVPFVYDIKDIWPEALVISGMFKSRFGLKLVNSWCNFVYRRASRIIVITPGFKQKLCKQGVPEDKIELIYEWCYDSQITPVDEKPELKKELGMQGRFNILFAGNMGKAQSLAAVLDAAKIVETKAPHVQFVFIGSGVEVGALKKKTEDLGLKNVIFHNRRPISEIGAILRLADVLLVHLRDHPLMGMWIPSKTQAYMASGRPILIGIKGGASDLVEKAKAGLACEPENPRDIAKKVLELAAMPRKELDMMGTNGEEFYKKELSFRVGVSKYEEIFRRVVSENKAVKHKDTSPN